MEGPFSRSPNNWGFKVFIASMSCVTVCAAGPTADRVDNRAKLQYLTSCCFAPVPFTSRSIFASRPSHLYAEV